MLVYSLAEKLGKTAGEILTMPEHEREGWIAYLAYTHELNRRA